mmetsp:Transcript_41209/g.97768  ORF Transcript_41209/g.97768 Transcript_41209/m.97768 type:complete len:237 (-) Transcript_41209:2-712(-)
MIPIIESESPRYSPPTPDSATICRATPMGLNPSFAAPLRCRLVLTTSSGHVIADAKAPATPPARRLHVPWMLSSGNLMVGTLMFGRFKIPLRCWMVDTKPSDLRRCGAPGTAASAASTPMHPLKATSSIPVTRTFVRPAVAARRKLERGATVSSGSLRRREVGWFPISVGVRAATPYTMPRSALRTHETPKGAQLRRGGITRGMEAGLTSTGLLGGNRERSITRALCQSREDLGRG